MSHTVKEYVAGLLRHAIKFEATLTTMSFIVKGEVTAITLDQSNNILLCMTNVQKRPSLYPHKWEQCGNCEMLLPPQYQIHRYPSGDIYIPLPRAESLLLHVW